MSILTRRALNGSDLFADVLFWDEAILAKTVLLIPTVTLMLYPLCDILSAVSARYRPRDIQRILGVNYKKKTHSFIHPCIFYRKAVLSNEHNLWTQRLVAKSYKCSDTTLRVALFPTTTLTNLWVTTQRRVLWIRVKFFKFCDLSCLQSWFNRVVWSVLLVFRWCRSGSFEVLR